MLRLSALRSAIGLGIDAAAAGVITHFLATDTSEPGLAFLVILGLIWAAKILIAILRSTSNFLSYALVARSGFKANIRRGLEEDGFAAREDVFRSASDYFVSVRDDELESLSVRLAASQMIGALSYPLAYGHIFESMALNEAIESALKELRPPSR